MKINFKSFASGLLIGGLIMASIPMFAANNTVQAIYNNIKITVNGKSITFPKGEEPVIINNRTYVPAKYVVEALDSTVQWDGKNNTVVIESGKNNENTSNSTSESKDKDLAERAANENPDGSWTWVVNDEFVRNNKSSYLPLGTNLPFGSTFIGHTRDDKLPYRITYNGKLYIEVYHDRRAQGKDFDNKEFATFEYYDENWKKVKSVTIDKKYVTDKNPEYCILIGNPTNTFISYELIKDLYE